MRMNKSYKDYERTIKLSIIKGKNKNSTKPLGYLKHEDKSKIMPIIPYKHQTTKNIGVLLDKLVVLDIDVGHRDDVDGRLSMNEWFKTRNDKKEIRDDLAETMRVKTPSDGMHVYFAIPSQMTSDNIPRIINGNLGLDILTGVNNFVPLPQTDRGDGTYELADEDKDKPIPAPDWLFDLIEYINQDNKKNKQKQQGYNRNTTQGTYTAKANAHPMERILQAVVFGFNEGNRNSEMTSLIGTLIFYIQNGKCTEDTVDEYLELVAKRCNPPMAIEEVAKIWDSVAKYQ